MPRRVNAPAIFLHKASGQAAFKYQGKTHYLGRHGSPEVQERYAKKLLELKCEVPLAAMSGRISIDELLTRFIRYFSVLHKNTPWLLKKLNKFSVLQSSVQATCGNFPTSLLSPKVFNKVKEHFQHGGTTHGGRSPAYTSECMRILKRAVRWGVVEDLVSLEVWQRLELMLPDEGVSYKRGTPVAPEIVAKTLPYLSCRNVVIIKLLALTGARPREILSMKAEEIDRSKEPWEYRPSVHKNQHRGKGRVILLGPDAQRLLCEVRDESVPEEFRGPITTGFFFPSRKRGKHYQLGSLCKQLRAAIAQAKVSRWHPYQLRHAAVTRIALEHGKDVAQAVAGHSSMLMTSHYDHGDLERAKRAAS
jgi:integrase